EGCGPWTRSVCAWPARRLAVSRPIPSVAPVSRMVAPRRSISRSQTSGRVSRSRCCRLNRLLHGSRSGARPMVDTAYGPPRACWGSPAVNATHAKQAAERALVKPLAGDRMEDDHDDEEGQSDRGAKEPRHGRREGIQRHADHRAQALGVEILRGG